MSRHLYDCQCHCLLCAMLLLYNLQQFGIFSHLNPNLFILNIFSSFILFAFSHFQTMTVFAYPVFFPLCCHHYSYFVIILYLLSLLSSHACKTHISLRMVNFVWKLHSSIAFSAYGEYLHKQLHNGKGF